MMKNTCYGHASGTLLSLLSSLLVIIAIDIFAILAGITFNDVVFDFLLQLRVPFLQDDRLARGYSPLACAFEGA